MCAERPSQRMDNTGEACRSLRQMTSGGRLAALATALTGEGLLLGRSERGAAVT